VAGLYSGHAEVIDRSQVELARGARAALAAVLVALTGDRKVPGTAAAAAVMKRAQKLMLGYSYESNPPSSALTLVAEFDERELVAELNAVNIGVWGKERPDIMLWLVIDSVDNRALVSGDEPGRVGDLMLTYAARRGIPALLPLMDIDESQHLVNAGDWPTLTSTARALSTRYATPATLVGHLQQGAFGFWEANWHLQVNEHTQSWSQEGDIVELMLEEASDVAADAIARRFADPHMLAHAEVLQVSILGVATAADYARVATYLNGLDTVSGLFVSHIDEQRVGVRFTARGGRAGLVQSISFGRVLVPVDDQGDVFRLIP